MPNLQRERPGHAGTGAAGRAWTANAPENRNSERGFHDTSTLSEALEAHGLTLPDNAEPGRIVRFPGAGKKRSNKAGWLKMFPDGQGAVFGDWSTGLSEVWQARKPVNEAERQRWAELIEKAQVEAAAERAEAASKAAKLASNTWARASAADDAHGYLSAKGVKSHGLRQSGSALLVPVCIDGEISSIQRINSDGAKRFQKDAKIKGGFHLIGEPDDRLIIAEGYATAATIHESTGLPVAVAFNAGNLKPVAEAMRAKYPSASIIIAADDDRNTEGNPGLRKAEEAAKAVSGEVVAPGRAGDFNDLASAQGAEAVRSRFDKAKPKSRFRFVKAGLLEIKKPEWLVQKRIEAGTLALLFGTWGTGKSFHAIDLACHIAIGKDFHGLAVKQGPVAYLAGEGLNGFKRRLRAWELYHGISLAEAPLYVSSGPSALTDDLALQQLLEAAEEIVEESGPPDAFFVDTVARNFGSGDENSAKDMNAFIAAADTLKANYNCNVILVHHTGHAEKHRARGSIALPSAVDHQFKVWKSREMVNVSELKNKERELGGKMSFTIESVPLGIVDDDGEEVTSAVMVPVEGDEEDAKAPTGKNQRRALDVLNQLVEEAGTNRIPLSDWRDACKLPRKRWREVITAETLLKTVFIDGDFVEVPSDED